MLPLDSSDFCNILYSDLATCMFNLTRLMALKSSFCDILRNNYHVTSRWNSAARTDGRLIGLC